MSATDKENGQILLWDPSTGNTFKSFRHASLKSDGQLTFAAPLRSGGGGVVLACDGRRGVAQAWGWDKEVPELKFSLPEALSCLSVSPCGLWVVGGGGSGALYLWSLTTGLLLRRWQAHFRGVTCLCWDPAVGGAHVASGGGDARVALWRVRDLLEGVDRDSSASAVDPLHTWSGHALAVSALWFSSGGYARGHLVSASRDQTVRWLCPRSGGELAAARCGAAPTCLAADLAERTLFLGASDGRVFALDMAGQRAAAGGHGVADRRIDDSCAFAAHESAVCSMCLTADGTLLITAASGERAAKVFDARSRALLRVFTRHKAAVCAVRALPPPPLAAVLPLRESFRPLQKFGVTEDFLENPESYPETLPGNYAALPQGRLADLQPEDLRRGFERDVELVEELDEYQAYLEDLEGDRDEAPDGQEEEEAGGEGVAVDGEEAGGDGGKRKRSDDGEEEEENDLEERTRMLQLKKKSKRELLEENLRLKDELDRWQKIGNELFTKNLGKAAGKIKEAAGDDVEVVEQKEEGEEEEDGDENLLKFKKKQQKKKKKKAKK